MGFSGPSLRGRLLYRPLLSFPVIIAPLIVIVITPPVIIFGIILSWGLRRCLSLLSNKGSNFELGKYEFLTLVAKA